MNDIASWLRGQIPSSTDADRRERLAREAELQAMLRSGIATMAKERTPSRLTNDAKQQKAARKVAAGV